MKYLRFALVVVCAAILSPQPSWREQVGALPDGSFMLATGWRIQPAGAQIPLDTLPMSSAVSPDGAFLLVLNGGYKPPSVSVLTIKGTKEIARVPVADGWLGLAFSPDGKLVYVGGGSRSRVFEFTFSAGELKPAREFEVTPAAERTYRDFIGDVAVSPDGRMIYASDLYHDSIVVINPQSGRVIERYKTGRRPYRILFHPDGKSFFVSSWADGAVYLHDAGNGSEIGRVRLGPHTTDMVLSDRKVPDDESGSRYRLFVAAANTNSVFVVGVSDTKDLKILESINVALTSRQPLGMTPSGLALSPDQKRLFTVCSDANVVAAADISESHRAPAGAQRARPAQLSEPGPSWSGAGSRERRRRRSAARVCGGSANRHDVGDRSADRRGSGPIHAHRAAPFALSRQQPRRAEPDRRQRDLLEAG